METRVPFVEAVWLLREIATHIDELQNIDVDMYAYCEFRGWKLYFFNDADQLDYLETVYSPDGRVGEFASDWGSDPLTYIEPDMAEKLATRFGLSL